MATVTLRNIRKNFGAQEVIRGIDLDIEDRQFVVFVGPSGCGKSTLLRLIAGLEEITSGDLFINGERVNDAPPDKRGLAMVFQSYALYPHMTVAGNLGFSLRLAGVPKAEREKKVLEAARILQIEALLGRKPAQLSGGQRQRVAIGRAIVRSPRVFLFDEPLSNLDAGLRVQMRLEIARLHENLNTTMVYVTHDQVEAMTLADKIVVLRDGCVEQAGAPLELYHHPRNLFVADFIGSPKMNLLPGRVLSAQPSGVTVTLPWAERLEVPVNADGLQPDEPVTLGVRPERVRVVNGRLQGSGEQGIGKPQSDACNLSPDPCNLCQFQGQVLVVERLGSATHLHLQMAGGHALTV
ncbi:MAG TPA: sn-glycerol-3-phosphate ABC transporter ATP-binding protein UgpC, partial [Blastocatellia bacterium]|nr:sn-glycerol-3-phosphate ABC transporter ATP-binding protein UgpC [Blastocatellia bacterium]